MIFQYFSRHFYYSRTFQESPLNSSTFQACANPDRDGATSLSHPADWRSWTPGYKASVLTGTIPLLSMYRLNPGNVLTFFFSLVSIFISQSTAMVMSRWSVHPAIYLVFSGAKIRPLSQWNLGDLFPNSKKKKTIFKKNYFFLNFHSITTHTSNKVTFSFNLMAIVCVIANLFFKLTENAIIVHYNKFLN